MMPADDFFGVEVELAAEASADVGSNDADLVFRVSHD